MQNRRPIAQADNERPVLESIVDFYNPSTNPHIYEGTPDDVVEKRVHSKGYHNMRFFCLKNEGRTQVDKIDEQSSIFGMRVKERWSAKYGRGAWTVTQFSQHGRHSFFVKCL